MYLYLMCECYDKSLSPRLKVNLFLLHCKLHFYKLNSKGGAFLPILL